MDDLLPNDGEFFQPFSEPEEQTQDRRIEAGKAQAARPMLEELIQRDIDRLAVLKSTEAINVQPTTDVDQFMRAWYGIQERIAEVQTNLDHLESLLLTTQK